MRTALTTAALSGALFLTPFFVALAGVSPHPDSPTTPQPFTFFCEPYTTPFIEGWHYMPNSLNVQVACEFTMPQTGAFKIMALHRGVVGDSVPVLVESVMDPHSRFITDMNFFLSPEPEQKFFAATYSAETVGELLAGGTYLRTGEGTPPADLEVVNWKWGPKIPSEFDPVIIIPGILGSWEKDGEWVLDPIRHTYDNLVDTLLANGYIEGQTLYKFPYDWHNSNVLTAQLLEQKIEQIKAECGCSYVDIVSHSMGGLVTAQYISIATVRSVDQTIYIATPFTGSPSAYLTWEGGEIDFGDDLINAVMRRLFNREARDNGYDSIFAYMRNKPVASVQELLPISPNYLQAAGSSSFLKYPSGYPRNVFLENLENAIENNRKFSSVRTSNIVGDTGAASTTIGFVIDSSNELPLWEHGKPSITLRGLGDDTVPMESTTHFYGYDDRYSANHNDVVSHASEYVFKKLNDTAPSRVINKIYGSLDIDYSVLLNKLVPSKGDLKALSEVIRASISEDSLEGSLIRSVLFITLFSPIEVEVTAPNGVVYKTASEHGYITVFDPMPGNYRIKAVGTGTGAYTIAASHTNLAISSEAFVDGNTTINQVNEYTLKIGSDSAIVIENTVPSYHFSGFLQPINPAGQPASIFKAGSTVPIKFKLLDAKGSSVQSPGLPHWLTPEQGVRMNASVSEVVTSMSATSGNTFRWDEINQQYIYNWNTKGFSGGYWYVLSALIDGKTYSATVGLR